MIPPSSRHGPHEEIDGDRPAQRVPSAPLRHLEVVAAVEVDRLAVPADELVAPVILERELGADQASVVEIARGVVGVVDLEVAGPIQLLVHAQVHHVVAVQIVVEPDLRVVAAIGAEDRIAGTAHRVGEREIGDVLVGRPHRRERAGRRQEQSLHRVSRPVDGSVDVADRPPRPAADDAGARAPRVDAVSRGLVEQLGAVVANPRVGALDELQAVIAGPSGVEDRPLRDREPNAERQSGDHRVAVVEVHVGDRLRRAPLGRRRRRGVPAIDEIVDPGRCCRGAPYRRSAGRRW